MLNIQFTDEALETLHEIKQQITQRWGTNSADEFEERTFKVITNIRKNPFIFQLAQSGSDIRRGLIHRNCSVAYKVNDERIDILFFWDNRQEPVF